MNLILIFLLLPAAFIAVAFSCSAGDEFCLVSFFNSSLVLETFLGDHGTVVFQNGLLKNTTSCPAMAVIFARGTAEPGEWSTSLSLNHAII